RDGRNQLAQAGFDLLRPLRRVHLRCSFPAVETASARKGGLIGRCEMSPELDRRIPFALLVLRFFLAIFLLQWSIEKLILPNAAAGIARNFYGVTLAVPASYALGVAELILSLALILGFYRTISYGLSLLVHTVTVIVIWR